MYYPVADRAFERAAKTDYLVQEGHLYTHASDKRGASSVTGLEFSAVGGDGTVSHTEVESLPKLNWSSGSKLGSAIFQKVQVNIQKSPLPLLIFTYGLLKEEEMFIGTV